MIETHKMMEKLGLFDSYSINRAVINSVYGISEIALNQWPFTLPLFDSERNCTIELISQMLIKPPDIKSNFCDIIEKRLNETAPGASFVESIVIASPDEICLAAISSCRGYSYEELFSIVGGCPS
jgi:hypothetical protein